VRNSISWGMQRKST